VLLSRGEYHSNITQQKPLKEFFKELKNNSKHKSRRAISRKTREEKILELKKLLILIKNLSRRTFGQSPEFSSFRKSSNQSIGTSPEHKITNPRAYHCSNRGSILVSGPEFERLDNSARIAGTEHEERVSDEPISTKKGGAGLIESHFCTKVPVFRVFANTRL